METDKSSQDGRGEPNPYSRRERLARLLWAVAYWILFRPVPRFFDAWHRFLLRQFGAEIGRGVTLYPSAIIDFPWNLKLANYCVIGDGARLYAIGEISIGEHSVVSQRAHLCAGSHDYTISTMPLLRMPIKIGSGVWICAEAFVGPNSVVGDRTVLGARSVAFGILEADTVYAGNPCKAIKKRVMRSRI